jgi:sodium-dependent phosphate cotransporter
VTVRKPTVTRRKPVPVLRVVLVVGMLYLFLVGVSLLETGISGLGADFQAGLVREVANPISGLFAGIILTVLVQSSSVSTATIVGLVGAGTLDVGLAVPMIMGANIGTTVTNTLASLGSVRRKEEFRRAFTAATMHDFFNVLAVIVLLPLELLTRFLSRSALWLTEVMRGTEVTVQPGPSRLRAAVKFPVGVVRDALAATSIPTRIGAILILALGIGLILFALVLITRNMRQLVRGSVERAMNRLIGRGGGSVGIIIGLLVTVAVQSSSITTSILVPLVAAGLLTARSAYPITLGANVGTTVTALIASLAVTQPAGLTIALVHTLFNVVALAIVFPVRAVRDIPVRLAEAFAGVAVRHPTLVGAYLFGLFLVIPLIAIFLIA